MLRQALAEVRLHPGRFVSTILAVAISVAFLAGSSVLVATEGRAEALTTNLGISRADLVVQSEDAIDLRGFAADTPGMADAAPVLQLTEPLRGAGESVLVALYLVPAETLRWAELKTGRWPASANEITLSAGGAQALGVESGGIVNAARDEVLTVVGITDEPSPAFVRTGYAAAPRFVNAGLVTDEVPGLWALRADPDADLAALVETVREHLAASGNTAEVKLAAGVRAEALAESTRGVEVFKYLLWAFAVVALVVGMITVANTFAITLAQRRRQIGLLRAVGASGAQVRRRFLAEAMILGVVGSALGVGAGTGLAALAAAYTGSLFWGLELPTAELWLAFGAGVTSTTAAAWLPILRGTRVRPLEALQPVLTGEEQRRASIVRGLLCGLLLVAGAGLVAMALSGRENAFLEALAAGALIALGVLFGAPLFVPGLLRGTGVVVGRFGPVASLAAKNSERNPRRATATATALMLAVGLIVTLQVGTASTRDTMLTEIARSNPVDISVEWRDPDGNLASVPRAEQTRLAMADGVSRSLLLTATTALISDAESAQEVTLLGYDPVIPLVTDVVQSVAADEVLVASTQASYFADEMTVKGSQGERKLRVVSSELVDYRTAIVSAETLRELGKPVSQAVMWLSVPDRGSAVDALLQVQEIAGESAEVGGSVAISAQLEQVLDLLLAITTALLGVAVLIALIGVSNTLGLSVLERTRESALLRALGLQARSLRVMLTIEALQVTLVGVLVGLGAGVFFGWLGTSALARTMRVDQVRFAVNLPQTLGMLALAVLAAALASVLPGRRAAKAAPTEALADI